MAIVTKIIKAYTKAIPLLVRKEKLLSANSAMSVAYQGTDVIMNSISLTNKGIAFD
jgi:hypothetical protein